ncbi:PrpF domain-containing protein [Feifania hominis]|uniref:PrpF family protein n=1 Tax=Feifania hominis TaxID=2763660 RepID=A0A926DFU3_9FIRM|nr:PrpF domain-containing protein [Feifania hominis]MBC8536250.1 PrpF family protein [Feifania hominis]
MDIPFSYWRGGTSRAVILRGEHLPGDSAALKELCLRIVRGRGGSLGPDFPSGKIEVVAAPTRPDADVDFTHYQVDWRTGHVEHRGSCGNLTSAIGPYAVAAGLVAPCAPETTVRIHNTNTGRIVLARIPVSGGRVTDTGDTAVAGAPDGAPVQLRFLAPGGSLTGRLFPTGRHTDVFSLPGGRVEATLIDCANPTVVVRAADLGVRGDEPDLDARAALLRDIGALRAQAAVLFGLVERPQQAATQSTYVPHVALLAPAADYTTADGQPISRSRFDFLSRAFIRHQHPTFPAAAAIAAAAATLLPGTVCCSNGAKPGEHRVVLGHPAGLFPVTLTLEDGQIACADILRSAHCIFDGVLHL